MIICTDTDGAIYMYLYINFADQDAAWMVMIAGGIVFLAIIIAIIVEVLKSPFHYPYFYRCFDVSGKKNPQIEDYIDLFLIAGNFEVIQKHNEGINRWKKWCQNRIHRSRIQKYRKKQFERCVDDAHAFCFELIRYQTRYRQMNYEKIAYKVKRGMMEFRCDYKYIQDRNEFLKSINYACTSRAYYSKNQRNLLTKELRRAILIRDNYTCQICGKYMPDEVGIHIDHIIPISKGGKTIASNLQVLCSKCNGRKSNKL